MPLTGGTSHYTGARAHTYHAAFDIPARAVRWVARLRAEKLTSEVTPEDAVLEYGVGAGWNLAEIRCRKRLGFDISDQLAPRVEALGIEFIRDMGEVPEATLDVVLCHHVLEHVFEPARTLSDMRRVLKPGGKLLLHVPYEREKRYRKFVRDEANHHLYSWNVQTLANLVEEVGFTVATAKLGQYGYDRFASVWASRLRGGEAAFRALRLAVHVIRPGLEVRVVAQKTV